MGNTSSIGELFPGIPKPFLGLWTGVVCTVSSVGTAFGAGTPSSLSPYSAWMVVGLLGVLLAVVVSRNRLLKRKVELQTGEQTARDELRYFKTIAAKSHEGILIAQDFEIKYVNPRALKMLGIEGLDGVSDKIMDYIHPDDMARALERFETLILMDEPAPDYNLRIKGPEEDWLWFRLRMFRIPVGDEAAALVYIHDISQAMDMEEELRTNQRMEALGVLSGGIVHDFNNILTAIIGNAELGLLCLPKGIQGREEFREIHSSGIRARELVRQILNLSRGQKGEVFPMSMRPMVKEGVKFLRSSLPAMVRITHHVEPDLDMVLANTSKLYQVFINLCTNAKQAMGHMDQGHLDIRVEGASLGEDNPHHLPAGEYITMSVADNGCGVDPENAPRIFDPYFTTQPSDQGTGLGLTASRAIVRECGGELFLESSSHAGSRFQVLLPVYKKERAVDADFRFQTHAVKGQGNILFCDDEKELTLLVRKMFESLGYNVLTTSSGNEALEFLSRDPQFFDLIITDLDMPGMGWENLVQSIRKVCQDVPLILCTGHRDFLTENQAMDIGAMEFVAKPYSLSALSSIASRYIPSPRA